MIITILMALLVPPFIGILLLINKHSKATAAEAQHVWQAESLVRQSNRQCLYDHDVLIAQINRLMQQCRPRFTAYKVLNRKLNELLVDRQRAERLGHPYATDAQRLEAQKVLGVDDSTTLQALGRAHKRALTPYDLQDLKARGAPNDVLETAIKRRAEIRRSYQLLEKDMAQT